jgi:hypothetical protein
MKDATANVAANNVTTIYPFFIPCYEDRWSAAEIQDCVEFWDLSVEETRQLLELRDRLATSDNNVDSDSLKQHWGNGPFELVRFVREHTCHKNVDIMERRVKQCVEWRHENQLDTILETYAPPKLALQFPAAIMQGADRAGDVVIVIRQGDTLGLLHRYGKEELIKAIYWAGEFAIRGPWQNDLPARPRMANVCD